MNYYRNNKTNVSIMEQPENLPLYDSAPGKSSEENRINEDYAKDNELVKLLYSELNSALYPFIKAVIDNYDYDGSPIYDADGITRETLSTLISLVLDMAAEELDDIDEIRLEVSARQIIAGWNRNTLLRAAAEALILNEIFMYRRPRRRRIYNTYSFKNGKYNGLKYS